MKTAPFVALAALGFVAGGVLLAFNRGNTSAGAPQTSGASKGLTPTAIPTVKSEVDNGAEAERNLRLSQEAFNRDRKSHV